MVCLLKSRAICIEVLEMESLAVCVTIWASLPSTVALSVRVYDAS